VNSYLNSGESLHQPFLRSIEQFYQETAGQVLGLIPEDLLASAGQGRQADIEKIVQVVIDIREKLREQKQYQLADQLRSKLGKVGITLVDKPEGTTFEYQQD
jgi:cysteinyl-tRNA synthetase